ncbi:sterol desaturase family protein [Prochlorococcus marinus]|uniref:sterol desaturase family protein n=2 Tax=Prochlorococcus marinus TaxID=1219 RepID=UPI001C58914B|nr:sterol desaturase family protein [Prochlorococcus marinus]
MSLHLYDFDMTQTINTFKINFLNLNGKYFLFIVLLLPFLISACRTVEIESFNSDRIFTHLYQIFLLPENSLLILSWNIFWKLTIFLSIVFTITLFEFNIQKHLDKREYNLPSLSRIKKSQGYKYADVWYLIITLIVGQFPLISVFLSLGTFNLFNGLEKNFHSFYQSYIPFESTEIVGSLGIIFAILLFDLAVYIRHRLQHKISWLWDFHEFHHSPTEMTIISKNRESTFERIFTKPLTLPITVLHYLLIKENIASGNLIPLIIYFLWIVISIFGDFLGHSSIAIIYPKPLSYIFMSPGLHLLHHSSNPSHYDCNFCMGTTIFDRLFGTYLDESHLKDIDSFGVKNTEYNKYHPLFSFTLLPLIKVYRRFIALR